MGKQNVNTSKGSNDEASAATAKRTGGVADYFTILGVGNDLLWKHTQKQREQQSMMEQQQQQQQHQATGGVMGDPSSSSSYNNKNNNDDNVSSSNNNNNNANDDDNDCTNNNNGESMMSTMMVDPNLEDQAALMERFYREIIDVTILAVHRPTTTTTTGNHIDNHNHHHHPPSSVVNASSSSITGGGGGGGAVQHVLTSSASEVDTDISNSQQQSMILPSPSTHSEATTVATTAILSTSDTATHNAPLAAAAAARRGVGGIVTTPPPPSEIDGFTLLAKTNPPQKVIINNNPNYYCQQQQQEQHFHHHHHHHHHHQQQQQPHLLGHALSASFSQDRAMDPPIYPHHHQRQQQETTSFPWNQPMNHHQNNNNKDNNSYVFDANIGGGDSGGGGGGPATGLREQVCTTVLQWEAQSSAASYSSSYSDHHHQHHYNTNHNFNNKNYHHHHPKCQQQGVGGGGGGSSSGASSVGGGSSATAASYISRGLRRKVESSWKRWNNNTGGSGGGAGVGGSANNNNKQQSYNQSSINSNEYNNYHYNPLLHSFNFYLGYKRRTPDQDHAPAIADLQLFYVRLPRNATTKPPPFSFSSCHHQQQQQPNSSSSSAKSNNPATATATNVSSPGSSAGVAAGLLASRVATAAGNVLFRSSAAASGEKSSSSSSGDKKNGVRGSSNTSSMGDTATSTDTTAPQQQQEIKCQRLDLEEILPIPEGFDRWSFPEAFKVIYVPTPQKRIVESPTITTLHNNKKDDNNDINKAATKLRQKTILVASPSHGQRRKGKDRPRHHHHHHPQMDTTSSSPSFCDHEDQHLPQIGSANSNTSVTDEASEQEAVEAYVEGSSSSVPNSPISPQQQQQQSMLMMDDFSNNNNGGDGNKEDDNQSKSNTTRQRSFVTDTSDETTANESLLFVPKVYTDVPTWESEKEGRYRDGDDDNEAQNYPHHPFYHSEDKWFYLPVLAIREQRCGDEERYHEDPGIVDLSVSFCDRAGIAVLPQDQQGGGDEFTDDIMMMEEDDEEFSLLSKTAWLVGHQGDNSCFLASAGDENGRGTGRKKNERQFRAVNKTLGSPAILLKRNIPIGFADLAFATSVLDRFPLKNYKGLPLPEEELPMFCYPTGCRLHRARFSDAPLPEYYGFVVKNERGDSIYVSCVSFMEPLTTKKVEQLSNMSEKRRRTSLAHRRFCEKREHRRMRRQGNLYCSDDAEPFPVHGNAEADPMNDMDDDDDESENCILTSFDTMTTFEKKTICLVSRYPFWTAFRRFLSHLHIMSGSSSDLPLERCISHLLLTVPVPRPGGPSVIVPLPALNQPMVMSLPPLKDFPLTDLPLQRLVACLDVSTIVTVVLGFLALEKKVIVMSSRPSLVSDACELLRSLLFPFDLCAPYVPRLTEPFMSCLEFPGAIFVGIHDDSCEEGLAAVVRKTPPEDSIIIDLDSGSMDCTGNRFEVLTSAWDIMPKGPRSNLVSELETLCRDADIVPGQEPLDSLVDSAFDAQLPNDLVEDFDVLPKLQASMEPLDDRAVRDAFLRFFCATLRGYERFLVVPDADFLISGNEWFDTQAFLSAASKENSAYLNSFVSTQLFQSFIQKRTEDSDVHCLMFDECLTEYHSAHIPYGRLGGDVETVVSSDNSQPHMLYSLLVDQSAAPPHNGIPGGQSNQTHDFSNLAGDRSSIDDGSRYGGDSDFGDSGSYALAKPSMSTTTDISDSRAGNRVTHEGSDLASIKNSESALTASGDIITAPPRTDLPAGVQFIYCVDGNPCFPHRLDPRLFLPREPDSWLVELSKTAPNPSLARSEREVEEANRRRRSATSSRGFHTQKRCLWQLPKLMGSHFLGSWLLCIPSQVAQPYLSNDQQSRHLLRALGALRLLRHKQRIIPDEAAYRALMVACGRSTSDRRVELVKLFGLLRSDGIFPTAVTLGQYTRALAEGYSKRTASGIPEDTNEFSGVEVTESMSMIRGSGRNSVINSVTSLGGSESKLFALDGNLTNLESAGRRWRQRSSGGIDRAGTSKRGSGNASPANKGATSTATDERHYRRRNRSWLPVVVSSSFVPNTTNFRCSTASYHSDGSMIQSDDVRLVALWSRTCACDSCGYIPLEEEVQAGWDAFGDDKDVQSAVGCPRCGYAIIPMLGYREMSIEEALELKDPSPQNINDADFAGLPPQVGPYIDPGKNKASFVTYVSPATLRLSLERYIDEMGEEVLSRERLKELDPEVFYNFYWYCARFNLPLPLPIHEDCENKPKHFIAFAAWERTAAERGCYSGAWSISGLFAPSLDEGGKPRRTGPDNSEMGTVDPFEEFPLLGRYNLQGFYPSVWDHPDLSEILVSLVTVCDSDRRDFKVVVEGVLRCNHRRRQDFGDSLTESGDIHNPADVQTSSEGALSPSVELDCYKTILYLAKYQCTTAFHTFFPAVAKPCKGYHFWCAIGTPLPIFDRLLREAVKRVNSKNNSFAPIPDVSDVALGFRCVFGHLI